MAVFLFVEVGMSLFEQWRNRECAMLYRQATQLFHRFQDAALDNDFRLCESLKLEHAEIMKKRDQLIAQRFLEGK